MRIRTIRTSYNRPPTCNHNTVGKSSANTVSILENEPNQLENEKRIVEIKISSVEKRIQEVQNEINSINNTLKETREYIEHSGIPSKIKHVTLEY